MDWIEHLFGISPDGGSGATETALWIGLLAVVAMTAAMLVLRRQRR